MKLKRRGIKRGRIEIIPLIDTILILLIFYMSFSSFEKKEKRIDAKMPLISTKMTPATKFELDLTLHVYSQSNILVNGAAYDAETLRDQMKQFTTTPDQQVTVVIEGEADTKYQAIISALDACAQAKLTKVAFRPLPEKPAAGAAPAPPAPANP
jgi:biopolymer transport protein ExbD